MNCVPRLHAAFVLALLAFTGRAAQAQRMWVRAGKLVDVRSGQIMTNALIEVRDGRVASIGPTKATPPGDSVLDLSAFTVLPGLIDAHIHLTIGGTVRANALADLNAGFTTVVDLGSRGTRLLLIRDSINAGQIPGPRVLAAGIWIGRKDGVCEFGGIGISGGAEGFRARVRENVAAGADVIKACVTGWPADAFSKPGEYEMPDSVLVAVVEEAKKLGKRVVAHDISAGGVRAALRAGVSGLAHAAYFDAPLAKEAAGKLFVISTLASLAPDSTPASLGLIAGVRAAQAANVQIVFGTDGGVLPHGQNALEFLALARAGVAPIGAIRAATINAATAFGIADSVGALAPGMSADLIAVEGDPLVDLTALQRVRAVVLRGKIVRR
jgi:imidazolonepropionase-like amidohydrolase